ncbi:transcriptional regulator with XRE-family HTH domain [Paenibacillus castaneae]|uniref:helix-turn-helix domain-containing protein n=1 Tax=Paenibacillus TaxID=44249 RepID=UPI001123B3F7|nr:MULTISPECIES: helix-turn-helix transcriptional regulator [Paenibacillus]NIK80539.1 transcriptional regulator with XRE-family HTH domain [Paenibacillus castaneae]
MTFGDYIKTGRAAKGLGKSELARRAGITPQYARDIEDDRTVPSEEKIELIVNVLELDERMAFKLANKLPVRIIEQAKKEFYA